MLNLRFLVAVVRNLVGIISQAFPERIIRMTLRESPNPHFSVETTLKILLGSESMFTRRLPQATHLPDQGFGRVKSKSLFRGVLFPWPQLCVGNSCKETSFEQLPGTWQDRSGPLNEDAIVKHLT